MINTLVDTTSLIALALDSKRDDRRYYRVSDERRYSNLISGIEAVLLSDRIYIDYPSYKRNVDDLPDLKMFNEISNFVNTQQNAENQCYDLCTDALVPLMNRPQEFLKFLLQGHIRLLECSELFGNPGFFPSTYWEDITRSLEGSTLNLVQSMESQFQDSRPHSGIALTALVRFLYYAACQHMYGCNLSLHYVKASLIYGFRTHNIYTGETLSKTILDVFDESLSKNYYSTSQKWLGNNYCNIRIPTLINYVEKNKNEKISLVESLLELRNKKICVDFRSGINELQEAIYKKDHDKITYTISEIEKFTNNVKDGNRMNPILKEHKISISIPFIGGLGTELSFRRLPTKKNSADKIITFLHNAIM